MPKGFSPWQHSWTGSLLWDTGDSHLILQQKLGIKSAAGQLLQALGGSFCEPLRGTQPLWGMVRQHLYQQKTLHPCLMSLVIICCCIFPGGLYSSTRIPAEEQSSNCWKCKQEDTWSERGKGSWKHILSLMILPLCFQMFSSKQWHSNPMIFGCFVVFIFTVQSHQYLDPFLSGKDAWSPHLFRWRSACRVLAWLRLPLRATWWRSLA